ncbi:glycosyltransferase family 4 protein [Kordiimonas sp.]|uniref:glycosyltransferase family 4 protein n=1 Tax=Kordiimonas sp. TaxID=1970157 RepID=UPI003A932E74
MKILFITDNFPPEVNAPASRTFEHCREWVELGADVTVITCAPNFPKGKVFAGYQNRLYQSEKIDGIQVIRVWSYIAENAGFIKRILDYVSFAVTAFWAGLFQKTDVIVATSPQFFTTFTGYALSRLKRRPWVFELRDLWPESIVTVGAMEKGLAIRILERIERFMYQRADLIVPVTEAFQRRLRSYGIAAEKMYVVTNGVDGALFPARPRNDKLREELGLQNKFLIGYVGTHGMAHNLEFVVEALAKFNEHDVHLLCIGDGARKPAIMEKAQRLGLSNVTFLDPVPKEETYLYLATLDAVLIPLRKADTFKTVIPSKIFESAAMQKPILLGVDGEARGIIERYNAGLYFEPENAESFKKALLRIKDEAGLRATCSAGGRALAAAYDRRTLARKMLDRIAMLTGTRYE